MPLRPRVASGVVVAVAVATGACGLIIPFEGRETISGGDGDIDAATVEGGDTRPTPPPPDCPGPTVDCVPRAPADWVGPLLAYEGDPATAPRCDAPFTETAIGDAGKDLLPPPPAACTCGCAAPTGVECSMFLRPGATTACGNDCGGLIEATFGTCTPLSGTCGVAASLASGVAFVTGGQCAPTKAITRPPTVWKTGVRACRQPNLVQSSCAANEVCAPKPPLGSPFFPKACIMHDGDLACPGEPYSTKKGGYFRSVADGRDCTACVCDSPRGGQCNASYTLHANSDTTCTTPINGPFNPSTCVITAVSLPVRVKLAGTATNMQCPPTDGGTSIGTATPAMPVTVCCLPS